MMLMESHSTQLSGSAISATIEGMRPMMVEVQSLVSTAVYGTPQRSTTGFDLNRLHMLLAVLEKRVGYFFNQKDVFLNIAGGFRISDPSIDLAVIAALVSSFEDVPWPSKCKRAPCENTKYRDHITGADRCIH
jgi:DNA repair protein RadA/Sms